MIDRLRNYWIELGQRQSQEKIAYLEKELHNDANNQRVHKAPKTTQNQTLPSGVKPFSEINLDRAIILKDISVTIPERKKFQLVFTSTAIYLVKQLEAGQLEPDHTIAMSQINLFLSVHIPEKAKPQHSVILFDNDNKVAILQFTLMDVDAEKLLRLPSPVEDRKDVNILELLIFVFQHKFQKSIVQSKQESCVAAHRGSKEGYLYLLNGYVFFGFKKPLLLFDVNNIASISYSSVIRVTFNMTINLINPLPEFPNQLEYEFSMIDQEDYDKVDRFVNDNDLNNESMSEARKARISAKDIVSNEIKKVIEEEGVDMGEQEEEPQQQQENDDNKENNNESSDDEELDQNYQMSDKGSGSESSSESESEDEEHQQDGEGDEEEEQEK